MMAITVADARTSVAAPPARLCRSAVQHGGVSPIGMSVLVHSTGPAEMPLRCGISAGPQLYLVAADGDNLCWPSRYVDSTTKSAGALGARSQGGDAA